MPDITTGPTQSNWAGLTPEQLRQYMQEHPTPRATIPSPSAIPPAPPTAAVHTIPTMTTNLADVPPPQFGNQPAPPKPESTWQKIGHGLARAGNIAGDIISPGTMINIPGTDLHKAWEQKRQAGLAGEAAKTNLETEQAKGIEQGNKMTPFTPFGQTEPVDIPWKALGPVMAAEERGRASTQVADTRAGATEDPALLKLGYRKDDKGQIVPIPDNELSPVQKQTRDLHQSVQELNDAKAAVENAKNDPNSPAFKMAQQRLQQAQQNAMRMTQALGLHEQEFENKKEEQGLLKPSGQAQSRASAAESVLNIMPGLEDLVRKNASQLGPLMGRINRGEVLIGNVDPKVAELYGAMKSFYALQPAVHGFRNAEFVKDFETALGTLERNPDAFIAGMHGLKPTLESVAKEGKTFHHRIVEGEENKPAAGNASEPERPQGVPPGYKFNANGPKGAGWYKPSS